MAGATLCAAVESTADPRLVSWNSPTDGLNKKHPETKKKQMHLVKGTSRVAPVSAAGSTVKTIARGNYTTIWNYREGYVATTDPDIAGLIAVGVACVGVAALIRVLRA